MGPEGWNSTPVLLLHKDDCVKQKLVPLVRQSLTRTGNLYLQNMKINCSIL